MTRVSPYRTTPNPAAMVAFLETLGLARELSSERSGFTIMRAGAGLVGVHPGDEVCTVLALAVDNLDDVRDVEDLVLWDEAYGRHGGVVDPAGGGIWIDEAQTDLHGYTGPQGVPNDALVVTAVRYSTDFVADKAFFARFGLQPVGHEDEWWVALRDGASGTLGLHRNTGEPLVLRAPADPLGSKSLCGLGFETTEPLEAVRDRLVAGGPRRPARHGAPSRRARHRPRRPAGPDPSAGLIRFQSDWSGTSLVA